MVQYILECIAFQLVFLAIYDFFLKRETFFQWNRAYLIGTYFLSLILPWIKIEAFKTAVPEKYYAYPSFMWDTNDLSSTTTVLPEESTFTMSWEEGILFGGMLLATLYFMYKLYQIHRLRKTGSVRRFPNFTQIIIENSGLAFSFFRTIFLGDKIVQREHENIIGHELVHIEQRHSLDLLFFELMRIVGWFNPLVYVYQNRVSELHEFIADSKAAKSDKKEQYEFLLSQVFQTENISFVNQFLKTSLIKKRIAMLQRTQSKKIWQLKYLLLVPLVLGMLLYTSSEAQEKEESVQAQTSDDKNLIKRLNTKIDKEVTRLGSIRKVYQDFSLKYERGSPYKIPLSKEAYFERVLISKNHFSHYLDSLEKAETPFFRRNKFSNVPLPSTARYESYVEHTKAFQILDKNLMFSITNNYQNGGTSIRLMDEKEVYPANHYVFRVESVKDLTGIEVRTLNKKLDEIFEQKITGYSGVILEDGRYAFEIYEMNFSSLGEMNKSKQDQLDDSKSDGTMGHEKLTALDKYNLLLKERKRLLKSTREKNPVIVNLDQQIEEVRKSAFGDGETVPFAVVDQVPVFPGCEDAEDQRACFRKSMQRHISKNFRYPEEAQEKGIQGMVSILFTISKTGAIGNIKMRGPHQLLEDEAERIIKRLPEMQPGKHKGELVNVPFAIPITFKLQSEKSESRAMLNLDVFQESTPLVFIDGEESTKEALNLINPNDIASIKVWKDETAIILYGEKGGNGVLDVRTKKNIGSAKESNEIYKLNTDIMSVRAFAKNKNEAKIISGTVTDGTMGLPGTTISIQGSERGVISDFDGKFSLKAQKGDVIVFQYIGLPIVKLTITDEENYQVTKRK